MTNPDAESKRSIPAALFLAGALVFCLGLTVLFPDPLPETRTASAESWHHRAEEFMESRNHESALAAAKAGLAVEPGHPGLSLLRTRLHVKQIQDLEPLRLWMDDLVLSHPRLAADLFQRSEFSMMRTHPTLKPIFEEALQQARD